MAKIAFDQATRSAALGQQEMFRSLRAKEKAVAAAGHDVQLWRTHESCLDAQGQSWTLKKCRHCPAKLGYSVGNITKRGARSFFIVENRLLDRCKGARNIGQLSLFQTA